ncbi:aldo/keto reductase [Rhodobacter sp. NSM]|uniref:aldo/keto reductase n=1 Tax=Rhodobacter sp. NSM TaxID=3457501 RepID=UPI003FCFF5D1
MTATLEFHDGSRIPQLGFGLWQVPEERTAEVVREALGLGYRLADGAAIYGNEAGLGEGFRASGLPRDEVFVTTKVWNDAQGFEPALRAVEQSLSRLGLDRLDLCLIHWPAPKRNLYVETWRALIRLRDEGCITSIGVSNFDLAQIDRLTAETGVTPVLNQIELHPLLQQAALRKGHAERGIVTQSWSPLARGMAFDAPAIRRIAERTGRSPAQVILRWHIDLGCSVIPRSTRREGLAENLAVFDFELTEADHADIAALDAGTRTGPDPQNFG